MSNSMLNGIGGAGNEFLSFEVILLPYIVIFLTIWVGLFILTALINLLFKLTLKNHKNK